MESISLLATVWEMSLHFSLEQTKEDIRDQSLFITWGWGTVVTEGPKGGITENFGRISNKWGPLKFAWKIKTWGRGSQKSSKVIRGDHFSKVTFKRGIGQILPHFAPNPPPPRGGEGDLGQ